MNEKICYIIEEDHKEEGAWIETRVQGGKIQFNSMKLE